MKLAYAIQVDKLYMTTYKEGPIYAEVVLGLLDTASKSDVPVLEALVLKRVNWLFKGGRMSAAAPVGVEVAEDKYFIDTSTKNLLTYLDPILTDKERREHRFRDDYISLREILRNRKSAKPMSRHVFLTRLGAMVNVLHLRDGTAPMYQMKTGLSAVYAIFNCALENCRTGIDDDEMNSYIREVLIGSTAASNLDVISAYESWNQFVSIIRSTHIVDMMKFRVIVERVLHQITSPKLRTMSKRVGTEWEESFFALDEKSMIDMFETLKIYEAGPDYSFENIRFRLSYVYTAVNIGSRQYILGISDLKRLSQMAMSSCSIIVAAAAQACTGSPNEKKFGQIMVTKMVDALKDMSDYATKVPVGSEVSVAKSLKKAFAGYLGRLAGPLCTRETVELVQEARDSCVVDRDVVDRWIERLAGLPANLAFNVGKVYKILPAPDSAPGAVVIDRLKQVAMRNTVDPEIFESFKEELTDQIVWGRMLNKKLPKLSLKPGVAVPNWWRSYRSGETDCIESTNIRNIVDWENSTDMYQRSPLDPSIWKDSGLGADTLEEGLDPQLDARKRNMLMRMIFDKECPMPGTEKTIDIVEWLSKSDQKPESHKDPARSIFSASMKVRFLKSYMELTVGKVMQEHPAYAIGASPTKMEVRLRAAITPRTSSLNRPFFYSFDIAGWSPRMPACAQDASHEIWGKLTNDPTWYASRNAMQGAKIYFSNSGYTGWYVNGEANLEGYDGKEMTMVNIAMLSLSVRRWRADPRVHAISQQAERDTFAALLFAYIDDGMARLELPFDPIRAKELFSLFTEICIETFAGCGFTVEPSKCFPSDRFFIFLNEAYLAGRHLVHGVRAAGTICALGTEKHETLINMMDKVSGGVRGAVMAGLDASAGTILLAYHSKLLLREWVGQAHPVSSAIWTLAPRAWGGLGMPNTMQLGTSTSGHAHVEAISTFNSWARISEPVRSYFINMLKTPVPLRKPDAIMLNPFSARVKSGYIVDTRVPAAVRERLKILQENGELSYLASEFLKFGDTVAFEKYAAEAVQCEPTSMVQAQYLKDLADAHPQAIFKNFCNRIERSATVANIIGSKAMSKIIVENRKDVHMSWKILKERIYKPVP